MHFSKAILNKFNSYLIALLKQLINSFLDRQLNCLNNITFHKDIIRSIKIHELLLLICVIKFFGMEKFIKKLLNDLITDINVISSIGPVSSKLLNKLIQFMKKLITL